jgi:predicted acetylornithine/succinylornithine family transaminase
MNTSDIIQTEAKTIVQTYVRPEVVFTHGEGAYLFDAQGERYLDFASGIAVTALGHADPEWVAAVADQAAKLTHVSNLYHTQPSVELAKRLTDHSFADKVYFCNTGSEANETALKFARKWAKTASNTAHEDKWEIVAFSGGFHGRTMGALSTTYKEKYRQPFGPLIPGVSFADFNDLESAAQAISANTCAVIVEPVQGEGGINVANPEFIQGLRALCNQHDALLIFDEIQCGLGRTGHLWAHEAYGIAPDIMTLAKPLAGGLPIGAALVTEDVAAVMKPGDHGSTFAAGPLVCRAAHVIFDRVNQPEFLGGVRDNGAYLQHRLRTIESDTIVSVRGSGLLVGVELNQTAGELVSAARDKGLLVISAGENVLRLAPPLIVGRDEIDVAVNVIERLLD